MKYFDYCKKYRLELFTIESIKRFKRYTRFSSVMNLTKIK